MLGLIETINQIALRVINNSPKKRKENMILETIKDIKTMKAFRNLHPDYPLIKPNKENNLYAVYLPLEGLYRNFYCPHFYKIKRLDKSNRRQSIPLRAEIDKILGIRGNVYFI